MCVHWHFNKTRFTGSQFAQFVFSLRFAKFIIYFDLLFYLLPHAKPIYLHRLTQFEFQLPNFDDDK